MIEKKFSPDEFHAHLRLNQPALLSASVTQDWKSVREWTNANGKANLDAMETMFGESEVIVADCSVRELQEMERVEMPLVDFIRKCREEPHRWYAKDWHFSQDYPDYGAYTVPTVLADDWMDEFWKHRHDVQDDFRFVYIGGPGTWTPFHADVFRSYSWSANVCGRKKWTLFLPGEELKCTNSRGKTVYDIRHADKTEFPHFDEAKRIEFIQEPGQVVFVPSGWFHQVENLDLVVSINHNWSNSFNLLNMYKALRSDLDQVEQAIGEYKEAFGDDWIGHCQILLRANSGWDYAEFQWFMNFNLERLEQNPSLLVVETLKDVRYAVQQVQSRMDAEPELLRVWIQQRLATLKKFP